MKKNKMGTLLNTMFKVDSRCMKDVNVKDKAIKLMKIMLEISVWLKGMGHLKLKNKQKDKFDYIKTKDFCSMGKIWTK